MVARVISIPVIALLVRVLDEQAFGQYSYLVGFTGLFAPLAVLGLPAYMSREVVQQRERAPMLLKTAYVLEMVFSAVTVLVMLGLGGFDWLLFLCAVGTVGGATSTLFQNAIIGLNRSQVTAAVQVVVSLFNNLLFLAVVFFKPELTAAVWVFALVGVFQHLIGYVAFRRYIKEVWFARDWPGLSDYQAVLRGSLPYLAVSLLATLYFRIDIVLLEGWSTLEQVARYSAAYKFMEIGNLLIGLVGGVFFAELSNLYAKGRQDVGRVMQRGVRYIVLITLPLAVCASFYARDILYVFYGDKYLQSEPILQMLAWTSVLLAVRNLQGGLVLTYNYVWIQVAVFGGSTVLNIGLNYLLIPSWGGLGAGAATLICEAANCLAFGWFIQLKFGLPMVERWLFPTLLALGAMLGVLHLAAALPAVAGLLLGVVTFGGVLYLVGGLLPEDSETLHTLMAWFARERSK
ncbi:MAG: flippase [Gemmatimonadaceae bacterium]|nr:flippase [Gloeobacterales cyanobacterium ES-bin-141]